MIHIYLVLGCWLPLVFPMQGSILQTIWFTLMGLMIGLYWVVTIAIEFNKISKNRLPKAPQYEHQNIALIGLSALLAGYPVLALAFVASAYAVGAVMREKKLAK